MHSFELSITADEEAQELLIAALSDLGATGFEQTDTHLLAYFDAAAFPEPEVRAALDGHAYQQKELSPQNWNAVWESNFPPVEVEDFCAVRAHFHPPAEGFAHEIVITPKMSFGTGHHATTWMMLRMMKQVDFGNSRVFDFGTGTGILAILAEKLGANAVKGIDVDHWSIENAAENAARNGCNAISLQLSPQLPAEPFDIILANINRNVILQYLPGLDTILQPGGSILLSGLMQADEDDIRAACAAYPWTLQKTDAHSNWICLWYVKER